MTDTYDRSSTGWDFELGRDHEVRPEADRQRCGPYLSPGDRTESWGDHRVTYRGSTCEATDCHVNHHPTVLPGWSEPMHGFQDRPGVRPVAAAMYGWDAAGMLPTALGHTTAWVAAHVALDALRDAGYSITPPADQPEGESTL